MHQQYFPLKCRCIHLMQDVNLYNMSQIYIRLCLENGGHCMNMQDNQCFKQTDTETQFIFTQRDVVQLSSLHFVGIVHIVQLGVNETVLHITLATAFFIIRLLFRISLIVVSFRPDIWYGNVAPPCFDKVRLSAERILYRTQKQEPH